MKTWLRWGGATVVAAMVSCNALAAPAESGRMARADAESMATTLIGELETEALLPADPARYAQAKAALLAVVAPGPGDDLDRASVYAAARAMLDTVDSDGHAQLWSQQYAKAWEQKTSGVDAKRADTARVVRAGGRDVLVVRPPQATFMSNATAHDYALALTDSVEQALHGAPACALVVDLSDQKGGNSWPPIALLGALVTPANSARFVDRAGVRTMVVSASSYDWQRQQVAPVPANPLVRFAGTPVGVVLAHDTASAGEMLAVMLAGEPAARSFGHPTWGMTTANRVLPLADGAQVLLTVARYAYGDKPAIRGGLVPDQPAAGDETPEQTVQRAADWAAATAPACATAAPTKTASAL